MEDTMRDLLDKLSQLEKPIKEQSVPEIGDAFGISLSEDFEIATEIVGFTSDGIVVELDDQAQTMLESQGVQFYEGYIVEEKQKGLDGKACWKGYRRMGTKMKGGKRVDNCVKVKEDDDVEESGLQYYTGKKKYGKDGMAALAAAGRKGASEEELGRIKDKYKKEDSDIDEVSADVAKRVAQARDRSAVANKVTSTQSRRLKMGDKGGDPDMNAGKALKSAMKRGAKDVYKEEAELDEAEYQGKDVPLGKKLPGDVKKYKVYVRKPNGNVVKVNFGDKKMRIKKSNPARRKSFRARHNCKNPGPRWKARYWSCRNW